MKEIIIDHRVIEEEDCSKTDFCYERRAHYYETDQMGIVHHSNYIRWMEEARIAYMDALGLPYHEVEQRGVLIPVMSVEGEYKNFVRFDETVLIYPKVSAFNGIRMTLEYRIVSKADGKLCFLGHSSHCFTTPKMQLMSLKKQV